ncbi:calcineurin-like phosphoesterase C-terminal domain-containing protein [Pedobacter puniceum]|uniref:Metallophosphoesterase n=1 Tax=Pedobacter puniceum TaxID=2666136 RepID=A0A7K0FSG9_9SPHI|nr:calcineurin-like phosphoesterase family protein [Pedobacter puniceum]MRX48581.1 metallophosphoesterase [Pedobacter puniceum]
MNRRFFIKSTSLLAGSAFISLNSHGFLNKADKTISGSVKVNGKALADVVISDGFSVVKTDKNGFYKFKAHDKATHVFMSTPAGYEFKTQNSISKQYENLNTTNSFDFNLTKLKQNDQEHYFVIWADPQVKNKADVKQMMEESVPDVQELVKDLGDKALVHGIGVGDLVWDELELFKDYAEAVKQMGIPFFQALGNHDMDYRQGGDETSDKTFKQNFGPTYYSFNRGQVHYVVLDDVRYLGEERKYDGYITDEQLSWLKKDLAFVPKEHLIVIGLHIPVHNAVKNNAALYEILKGRQVHIMSGHTHYNDNFITDNVYEHVHGTVCGAWWTGPICGDGAPRGYGVYHVKGNQLSWYYKSMRKPKTHQISLHIEELTAQKRLLANVWNWDPQWKIEWWADDKYMGLLEQTKGFDPLSVKLYKGDQLPKPRSFAEPRRTEHLFMAHINPEVRNIKVQATDRFGNKYEEKTVI